MKRIIAVDTSVPPGKNYAKLIDIVEPDETLHVGDNLKADVTGAAAAGLRTAWITRRIADPDLSLEAHEGPAPDLILHDLSELPSHLS